eukprot:2430151-Rhodomonas_salina.1
MLSLSNVVEQLTRERAQLQGLLDEAGIYVPSEVSRIEPVIMIEELCGLSTPLHAVLIEGLEMIAEGDHEPNPDAIFYAVQHVVRAPPCFVEHLEQLVEEKKEQEAQLEAANKSAKL